MKRSTQMSLCALALGLLTLTVGCPEPIIETYTNSNGDSGNVVGVVIKLAHNGAIGDLNSAEWQLLTTKFDEILAQIPPEMLSLLPAGTVWPELTDEQALAVVEFLNATGTEDLDDIPALVQQVTDDPTIIPTELVDLLVAMVPELEDLL